MPTATDDHTIEARVSIDVKRMEMTRKGRAYYSISADDPALCSRLVEDPAIELIQRLATEKLAGGNPNIMVNQRGSALFMTVELRALSLKELSAFRDRLQDIEF